MLGEGLESQVIGADLGVSTVGYILDKDVARGKQ